MKQFIFVYIGTIINHHSNYLHVYYNVYTHAVSFILLLRITFKICVQWRK